MFRLLMDKEMTLGIPIPEAIKQLLEIVEQLRTVYPTRRFTLDGRLLGDLGEVIAEEAYDIKLYDDSRKHHDAECPDGRRVQIKATMQTYLTFPCNQIPDYYLGIKIHADGTFTEVFNGPGSIAWEAIKRRQRTKTNLHTIAIAALAALNERVPAKDRIPRRAENDG
jgi:hypothetical protein